MAWSDFKAFGGREINVHIGHMFYTVFHKSRKIKAGNVRKFLKFFGIVSQSSSRGPIVIICFWPTKI